MKFEWKYKEQYPDKTTGDSVIKGYFLFQNLAQDTLFKFLSSSFLKKTATNFWDATISQ